MAIEVFNRHENKYLIDEQTLVHIQARLADYMETDAYNKTHETYTITNLYYDTEDNHLIHTSLLKPKYKEKLRLRGYGVPDLDSKVYLEIKKKVAGLVNKRRSSLILSEAYQFLETGNMPAPEPYHNRQVLNEIAYILQNNPLKPMLYLAYDRRAYFDKESRDLRISFDTNIRSRRIDLRLEAGDHGRLILPEGQWLMEIKVSRCMPFWLTRLLSEYQIYPTSFSKYGTEYKQLINQKTNTAGIMARPAITSKQFGAALRQTAY